MYIIIVYDTDQKNCAVLHKHLKKFLHWNQNSVFEGTVSKSQFVKIKDILERKRAENSHIIIYSMENDKLVTKEELGECKGGSVNVI